MWIRLLKFLRLGKLSVAEREAYNWKKEAMSLLQQLAVAEKRVQAKVKAMDHVNYVMQMKLEASEKNADAQLAKLNRLVEYANKLIDKHDDVVESLTTELKILKEIVVPELTLANESLRSQMEADVALQGQRQAAYAPPVRSVEE